MGRMRKSARSLRVTMIRSVSRCVGTAARSAAALLCVLAVTSGSAWAQGATASIRGSVQDSSGAVLPGATVTLTNVGTKAVHNTVTDDRGQYQFPAVFAATYDLRVELAG